jgi:salicylate hydroxylase
MGTTSPKPEKVPKLKPSSRYDMYKDIEERLAKRKGSAFTDKYTNGLPFGLKLSNGVIIGE